VDATRKANISERFEDVYRIVDGWVNQKSNVEVESTLRKEQEELVPLLLGYPKRGRRLSTLVKPHHVEVSISPKGTHDRRIVQGEVRDVSGGEGADYGCGIHVYASQWAFQSDGGGNSPKSIVARNRTNEGSSGVSFSEATVELSYTDTSTATPESLRFECKPVRAFGYKERYGLPGGGVVLFLDQTSTDFNRWRDFVGQLTPVDYKDQVG